LEARRTWIEQEVAAIEGHRETVALQLVTLVQVAVSNLREAQRLRLPTGLGDWSNAQYLHIRFSPPDSVEEMKLRVQVLIDELIQAGQRPEGLPLLLRAVRAVNRRQGVEVSVLKPNEGLRLERAPVSEISTWSGGQKLTTAILIYCVLIRLREMNRRGRHESQADVLVLDNPIGKANLMTLIDLQRKVAELLRIQLIFTTGVDDKAAVAAFPNVIRLRNAKDRRTGAGFVRPEAEVTAEGPYGTVTGTRVYRRTAAVDTPTR
jgi:hypothetical protein